MPALRNKAGMYSFFTSVYFSRTEAGPAPISEREILAAEAELTCQQSCKAAPGNDLTFLFLPALSLLTL